MPKKEFTTTADNEPTPPLPHRTTCRSGSPRPEASAGPGRGPLSAIHEHTHQFTPPIHSPTLGSSRRTSPLAFVLLYACACLLIYPLLPLSSRRRRRRRCRLPGCLEICSQIRKLWRKCLRCPEKRLQAHSPLVLASSPTVRPTS